jgi:hypothetical protein
MTLEVIRLVLLLERLELIVQYQRRFYDSIGSTKSALKQTVLGAKYLIYDPFKNQEQVNNSWKLIILSICPAVSFCRQTHWKTTLIIFSLCQYFTKSHADYSKSSGWWNMGIRDKYQQIISPLITLVTVMYWH